MTLVEALRSELRHALAFRQPRAEIGQLILRGIPPGDDPSPMVAVDGSYSFLWSTSDIWVALVRVAAITYHPDGSGTFHKADLVLTDRAITVSTNEDLVAQQDDLHRSLYEATQGLHDQQREMVNEFRRLVEGQVALDLAHGSEPIILALDGSLASFPRQQDYLGPVVEACKMRGHIVVGISKDSMTHAFQRALTDEEFLAKVKGVGYLRVPQEFESRQKGLLHGDVYFARLHADTPKWFRVDLGNPREEPDRAFGHLSSYASSAICLGYPFPLLEAHRAAVTIRQFRAQFEDLVLKEALASGMDLDEAMRGMVDMEGKRMGAFHEYLDKLSRDLK